MRFVSYPTLLLTASVVLTSSTVRADETPLRQLIDAEVKAVWQRENVTPAPAASDAAFLRRIYLDLVGTIPTAAEAREFLADKDADKRAKLIDKLLDDPRYAEQQMNVWDQVLFGRRPPDSDLTQRREGFQKWLREKFAKNEPYDRWVRELLQAEGWTSEGPTMYFAQYKNDPESAATAVSRIFLGTQLQCARCHDHPFDKWKQVDFYGLAGFLVRQTFVEGNQNGKRHYLLVEKSSGEVLFSGPAAEQKPGKKGDPVPARYLGGDLLQEPPLPAGFKEPELKGIKTVQKPLFSRKQKLAEWITAADNPYFAKAISNRIWAQFMGKGLVDPVDDLRDNRPASHPKLFQAVHEQLVAQKFDLKWLVRELVNSQAYQLSVSGAVTDASPRFYERSRVRPLSAEEIMASFRSATGFDDAVKAAGGNPATTKTPEATYFLPYFGEPTNGRGDFQASLNEHLFLNNSGSLRQSMIQPRKGNLADRLLTSKEAWEERVDELFLSVLTRLPREQERKKFVEYLTADKQAGAAIEDAIWVLLNTAEFRFNH
ncbi:MAG: DUF1549 and DUF1553 domain-containing protein [Gemmataceae bacterium]|nr:DUF1549 and DUF1553 domain-containing protein [Gemmataceae bacterium]